MVPGDVVFFSPTDAIAWLSVAGQGLSSVAKREPWAGNWSHVAICVEGPLIFHAMPNGGVQFEILNESKPFTVYRYRPGIDVELLHSACVYWLGESYSLLPFFHRSNASGLSFCSSLVQKVFGRLDIPPFQSSMVPMFPTQLADLLSKEESWECLEQMAYLVDELDRNDPRRDELKLMEQSLAKMSKNVLEFRPNLVNWFVNFTKSLGNISDIFPINISIDKLSGEELLRFHKVLLNELEKNPYNVTDYRIVFRHSGNQANIGNILSANYKSDEYDFEKSLLSDDSLDKIHRYYLDNEVRVDKALLEAITEVVNIRLAIEDQSYGEAPPMGELGQRLALVAYLLKMRGLETDQQVEEAIAALVEDLGSEDGGSKYGPLVVPMIKIRLGVLRLLQDTLRGITKLENLKELMEIMQKACEE